MPKINAPPIEPQPISDLDLFAKAYFNIELTNDQKLLMKNMAAGKMLIKRRQMGQSTVKAILQSYIEEGLKPGGRVRLPIYHLPARPKIKGVTQEGKVLNAIKHGGAFNFELSRIALKYTSVISELRKDGHNIIAERQIGRNGKKSNTFRYYLIGE